MTPTGNHKRGSAPAVDAAAQLRLYERMVLIRRFELRVQRLYRDGKIPGFIHLYVGEEATAVGVCAHLGPQDVITSTHRGHGHALAKAPVAPKGAGRTGRTVDGMQWRPRGAACTSMTPRPACWGPTAWWAPAFRPR